MIRRVSRQRMATVYAEIDDNKGNRQEILRDLTGSHLPSMQKRLPSVRVSFEGQRRQQEEVVNSMVIALPLALFGIFLILVMTFQSYLQAFIILTTIPFGVIGAIFGHMLLGMPLTILSFFGIVGVSGIVVNDSLVLMDALNRNLRQGMPLFGGDLARWPKPFAPHPFHNTHHRRRAFAFDRRTQPTSPISHPDGYLSRFWCAVCDFRYVDLCSLLFSDHKRYPTLFLLAPTRRLATSPNHRASAPKERKRTLSPLTNTHQSWWDFSLDGCDSFFFF